MKTAFDYKLKEKFENKSKNCHGVVEKHGRMGFIMAETREEAEKYLKDDAKKHNMDESIYELC